MLISPVAHRYLANYLMQRHMPLGSDTAALEQSCVHGCALERVYAMILMAYVAL